jgi:DNA-binding NtrC family response regulator
LAHTVLVVEDEAVIREDISSHLEDLGLTVFQAESASGAISKIMRHPEIALVFTNIRMPGPMDGRDLVLWLQLNHPRVVVMVATGGFGRINAMKDMRVACAFLKPYKPEMVSASIFKVLEHRTAQ